MATQLDAQAVKSLNNCSGRRRFVFKTFSERVEDIDIGVFRSLHPLKLEPSQGSSFFRDCLVQWRELNTAEDFISFYEEMTPLVQTLPQIILKKELILSKLLFRLQMKGRLSLEPILRLMAALSRDLLEDFSPFLERIVDSLVLLLKSGADREPDIIEQIFTSWSYIMMYLQKYLIRDIVHVLKVTVKLRYYQKDYVQEFMAESVSFLFRNAPDEQLIKGIRKIMFEYVKKPIELRKSGSSALLCYTMRGTSSRLHSRAEKVLLLLMDSSIFGIGDKLTEGSDTVVEVVIASLQRICGDLEPKDMNLVWDCLYGEITECLTSGYSLHLKRLLSLLISTIQIDYLRKTSDYRPLRQLVGLLVQTFIKPPLRIKAEDHSFEVIDKVLQLILCFVDGIHDSNDMKVLSEVSLQWAPVFELRISSLLTFIKGLLLKDPDILHAFRINILTALNDLIENSEEEVVYLLVVFCERLQMQSFGVLDGTSKDKFPRIHNFLQVALGHWIGLINDAVHVDPSHIQFQDAKLALLWGIISCYPCLADVQSSSSLLMDLVDALDQLLKIDSENIAGFPKQTWQSLIGAGLNSYHKLHFGQQTGYEESAVSKFLYLAKKYKTSSQILFTVADFLDSVYGSTFQVDISPKIFHSDLEASKAIEALDIFAENLCHPDKRIRICTLRILCHYEPLNCDKFKKDYLAESEMGTDLSLAGDVDYQGSNVVQILHSIETTSLSISTSRKVILWISRIQMGLLAASISETYLPSVLYGIIGIFHNRFSYLWNPAIECLAVLIGQYTGMVWERYVQYLERCQTTFLTSYDESGSGNTESLNKSADLVECFNSFVTFRSDRTPCTTVLTLLIQSLQKIPTVSESRSSQIIPLFLKFLGYSVDDIKSVKSYILHICKGKEWRSILKEWLNLLHLMRNSKSFYQSQFLKEVLQYRLLDENDAELQMKVLDCLLNWKDDYLLPYDQHLKRLISTKNLREELTIWSVSRESNLIDERHRSYLVPIVIRILIPKVRKLKTLASRKLASVNHRKAVLRFLSELDIEELPLFYALLVKPLQAISQGVDAIGYWLWKTPESSNDEFDSSGVLRHFTVDNIKALSWKKKYGFLHVIEDILIVFDEFRINPFLDLLMGCVVRILASCTSSLDSAKSSGSSLMENNSNQSEHLKDSGAKNLIMTRMATKQFKDLRSLCLKIISFVLGKFEDHDFGDEFWNLFFTSVKPLIDGFKQEGASSEKPSSLFSCFLAMSGSYRLVPLLYKEKNLVPDIFSILTVPTASEAIVSCVLKFTENLLNLDSRLDNDDNAIKRVLLPNLDALVCSLHNLFTCKNATKRNFVKSPGERELNIFKLLSKYIKDPSAAWKFVDILLPLLAKRPQNLDACVEMLQVIRHILPLLGSESTIQILNTVSPLVISACLDVRLSICDLLDILAAANSSLLPVAKLLRELNATSALEMGGLDYDTIISAYEKIDIGFFYTVREEHASVILSHFVHDLSSEELILRQSAYRILLLFVEFAGKILDHEVMSDEGSWSRPCIEHMINNFLLKNIGDAMNKEASVQKVWIELLREMVLKLPMVPSLKSYQALCSEDAEQDFFNNVIHLQKHRRARALTRFRSVVSSGCLSEVITNKVFVPLLFNTLFDVQDGKGEHLRNAALDALASISGSMEWKQYYALVNRCFREMTLKPDKQKLLLRLICSLLDHFHFLGTNNSNAAKDSVQDDIQTCLGKIILPKVQKVLTSDSDNVNVNISLVALKLLKLLPGDIMELQLPNIVHRISNFLKNRLESIRDEARSALAACLKELGLGYLQFIVKVLRTTLKRGYELHVLGYTLNFILSKCLLNPINGELDYCLEELLSVVENDILGDVSEEKEVEKIASKMKETRKRKSFETLQLISQNVTFKTHALKLLSPITVHLQKQLTPKVKLKLEAMLNSIAAGIECNRSVDQTDLFIFTYGLIEDGITNKIHEHGNSTSKGSKQSKDETSSRVKFAGPQCSHVITTFALGILYNRMKNMKLHKDNEQLLSMLDPFVRLLSDCLSSKYEDIITTALRCLSPLVRLPLPSLQSQADKIKTSILVIAQGSIDASSPLMQSCIRLLTVLLRSTSITLSSDQLQMLLNFPLFVDLERNPSFLALSLLKAIVNRKLVVSEIYDVVTLVSELMVTSQVEPIRKKCSQVLLQFLLDYHLKEKRLDQHLTFLLANLRYQHPTGREAVLEMLHAIIIKFPKDVVDDKSKDVFVHLVHCLANDHDNKVRSMTGAAIKLLVGRVGPHSLDSILEYSLSWYMGQKQHLWSTAAQVLGLLVEVMKKGFQKHINSVLCVMRSILQSAVDAVANRHLDLSNEAPIPFWKEAYYSLVMLEKLLHQFPELCLGKDLEDIWERACEFLLHPHMWLRNISSRLLALYFAKVAETCRENHEKFFGTFSLTKLSRLFLIAVSLSSQLRAPLTDDAANVLLTQNLVFAICGVHSLLGQNEYMSPLEFWSTIEHDEHHRFLKAFEILDPRKGRSMFASITSGLKGQNDRVNSEQQYFLVSYLLKRLGKIVLQMEATQMKIVFNIFKSISPKIFEKCENSWQIPEDVCQNYACQVLLPLYKVCEGFAGKVVADDVKQLAQEVCERIRKDIGVQNFVQVYSQIRKNLKAKRDKRRQEEKVMAVVNPERNAKRKLRNAAKHRANKKRKLMTIKMGRWLH